MQEPEAELQATADLSPVSPSPVHTATQVVPALQDTVDTIDAMVAAAAAPNGVAAEPHTSVDHVDGENGDDVVDDDSFDEAYADEPADAPAAADAPRPEQPDVNDDYAKTFDSPIDPEEGEGHDDERDVPSVPAQSNDVSLPTDHLTTRPSDVPPVAAVPSTSEAQPPPADVPVAQSKADPNVDATPASLPAKPAQDGPQSTSSQPTAEPDSQAVDIQQLMAELTSQHAEPSTNPDPSTSAANSALPVAPGSLPASALPSSSSLPPRPPLPQTSPQSYAAQNHPSAAASNAGALPGQTSPYVAAGAPGTFGEAAGSLPPPPGSGLGAPGALHSLNAPQFAAQAPDQPTDQTGGDSYQRAWEQFVADERQYMAEAKWDRFPEGSRIFIGNLSSDKVSKRDVFDMFYRFGRLAQISLKSAYGFVQYHTLEEGSSALENLQGIEIKGRRIHLEISRVQDKSKKDRNRSPDRGRGREGSRRGDKFQNRDDYRPSRNHSPRRNDYGARDNGYGRERGGYYDSGRSRGRSRSPDYGRNDKDYRRRSPSPYGQSRHEGELDLPRRYGADVPDVQLIAEPGIHPQFLSWVEDAFKGRALKTEVMYLHPRIPKEQVIQRQAAEGVHAVVDLDYRSQSMSKIPVQAFDRSAGSNNVRFDKYVDLDPGTAAEVILRAKASGAPPPAAYGRPAYGQPQSYGPPSAYANAYGNPPPHVPQQAPPPAAYPPQQAQPSVEDIARAMGGVDNATLQKILATMQGQPQHVGMPPTPVPAAAPSPQVDIQALLGSLGGGQPPQQHGPPQPQYGAPQYGAPSQGPNGDQAAHVQNIMSQLARYRQ